MEADLDGSFIEGDDDSWAYLTDWADALMRTQNCDEFEDTIYLTKGEREDFSKCPHFFLSIHLLTIKSDLLKKMDIW